MMVLNNIGAMFSHRQLEINNSKVSKYYNQVSSGQRITKAGDDAAGLAVSEKLETRVRGFNQVAKNIQDSVSLLQTVDGAFGEISQLLNRGRTLAVQAANETLTNDDRAMLQTELSEIMSEIDRISSTVTFNNQNLLTGSVLITTTTTTTVIPGSSATSNMAEVVVANSVYSRKGMVGTDGMPLPNTNSVDPADYWFNGAATVGNFTSPDNTNLETITPGSPNWGGYLLELDASASNRDEVTKIDLRADLEAEDANEDRPARVAIWDFNSSSWVENAAWSQTHAPYGDNPNDGADDTGVDTPTAYDTYEITTNVTNYIENGTGKMYVLAYYEHPDIDSEASAFSADYVAAKIYEGEDVPDQEITTTTTETSYVPKSFNLQLGNDSGDSYDLEITATNTTSLGLDSTSVSTRSAAETAISAFDSAISTLLSNRAEVGGVQNRLENAINFTDILTENETRAISTIRDTDMASSMTGMLKSQILAQSAYAMHRFSTQQMRMISQLLSIL